MKIYQEEEEQKVTHLKLTAVGEGTIHLDGLDKNGKLLCIVVAVDREGRVLLPNKIPKEVSGIKVDNYGRVRTESLAVKTNPGGEYNRPRFFR